MSEPVQMTADRAGVVLILRASWDARRRMLGEVEPEPVTVARNTLAGRQVALEAARLAADGALVDVGDAYLPGPRWVDAVAVAEVFETKEAK